MDLKVIGRCFVEQGSGMVMDEAGGKLPAKFILFCNVTPLVITEDGDLDKFKGRKMDVIHQADD